MSYTFTFEQRVTNEWFVRELLKEDDLLELLLAFYAAHREAGSPVIDTFAGIQVNRHHDEISLLNGYVALVLINRKGCMCRVANREYSNNGNGWFTRRLRIRRFLQSI